MEGLAKNGMALTAPVLVVAVVVTELQHNLEMALSTAAAAAVVATSILSLEQALRVLS